MLDFRNNPKFKTAACILLAVALLFIGIHGFMSLAVVFSADSFSFISLILTVLECILMAAPIALLLIHFMTDEITMLSYSCFLQAVYMFFCFLLGLFSLLSGGFSTTQLIRVILCILTMAAFVIAWASCHNADNGTRISIIAGAVLSIILSLMGGFGGIVVVIEKLSLSSSYALYIVIAFFLEEGDHYDPDEWKRVLAEREKEKSAEKQDGDGE